MIKKIAHLADIHIRKAINRHGEYKVIFEKLYKSLKKNKPDVIVIVGDLVNDYNKIEGEQLIIVSDFLNSLAAIAPVRITRGNHDLLKHSSNRIDSIEAVVRSINNPKIIYYNETNFFEDKNIVWAVWKHGEKKNNPWDNFEGDKDVEKTYIDLYHDPINGSTSVDGFQFKSKTYRSITDFKGDLSFFGDIHQLQFLDIDKTKAYSSSLIEQTFGEGDGKFHGYLMWDVPTKTVTEVEIKNEYTHKTVVINRFHNFDDLDFEIEDPSPMMRIRFLWRTLPAQKTVDNERKIVKYVTDRYKPIIIKQQSEFVEDAEIKIEENSDILNITKREVIHSILRSHLEKVGETEEIIEDVLNLDVEIESRIELDELTNIQWSILKFSGKNFRSYKNIEVDWSENDGIYQISGKNTAGKCLDKNTEIEIEFDSDEIKKILGFIPEELL